MAWVADAQDPVNALKRTISRELWRIWKFVGAFMCVYLVLVKPLFDLSEKTDVWQAWAGALSPTLIALALSTPIFYVWSICSFWLINTLVLKRYPADLPVVRLRPPLGFACLVIFVFGCLLVANLAYLPPIRQVMKPMVEISGPAIIGGAFSIEKCVTVWHTARQAA
jgi:hypothetical protein